MPNWCEGSLKVKGKRKDVFNFFTEGVNVYEPYFKNGEIKQDISIPKEDWLYIDHVDADGFDYIYYSSDAGHYVTSVYMEGTNRAFISDITGSDCVITIPIKDDNETVVAYAPIKQAWDFRIDDWVKLSKITHLRFKLYGIEMGAGFMHTIEVNDGEIIEDETMRFESYDDFIWNCPIPWMGG